MSEIQLINMIKEDIAEIKGDIKDIVKGIEKIPVLELKVNQLYKVVFGTIGGAILTALIMFIIGVVT